MFQRYMRYIYMLAWPILNTSCIFDDETDCPAPEYAAEVSIKDINYDNISAFPHVEVKNKDMPFRSFAKSICYVLSDMSGKHVRESAIEYASGESPAYHISFGDIPEGDYVLTVWGNLTEEYPAETLHPDGQEFNDIYTASRTVRFDGKHLTAHLGLERTKGLLLLSCAGFPDDVSWIKMSVSGMFSSVSAEFNYSGSGNVEKAMPFRPFTTTLLSPSTKGTSLLRLSFHTGNPTQSEPFLKLPDINLPVSRNEISSVAIDYSDVDDMCEIRMFINEHWVTIHRLYIN